MKINKIKSIKINMKTLFIFCILNCFLLTGCNSINYVDRETYESLKIGINLLEKNLQFYVDNDNNLNERTKNSIKTEISYVKNAFKTLKEKK